MIKSTVSKSSSSKACSHKADILWKVWYVSRFSYVIWIGANADCSILFLFASFYEKYDKIIKIEVFKFRKIFYFSIFRNHILEFFSPMSKDGRRIFRVSNMKTNFVTKVFLHNLKTACILRPKFLVKSHCNLSDRYNGHHLNNLNKFMPTGVWSGW